MVYESLSESVKSNLKTAIHLHNRYLNDGGEGLGPEAGHYAGLVIATMTPEELKQEFPDGVSPKSVAAFLEPKI